MTRVDFLMPALGADMESGTLTQWLKNPGDRIHRGDALAVVETAKGLIDIEAFDEGVLEELVTQPGATIPVGAVLARIAIESARDAVVRPIASPPVPAGVAAPQPASFTPPVSAQPAGEPLQPSASSRQRVSPAARRRAHELGVELANVKGTGPEGVIRIEDIERHAKHVPATAAHMNMRETIGAAMARSKREIPHYYLSHAIDFAPVHNWLTDFNTKVPVGERLLEAVLLVRAIALTAAEIKGFSGNFRNGEFHPSDAVHLGVAIALRGGGLVAPALLDADRKDLKTLMAEFSDLVARVRSGHMRSGELASATLTLTSLGSDSVDMLFPIINPPQVAIVGAGAITERPWVFDGTLAVRPVLTLTLGADHRVTDGRTGSRFLRRIAELLTHPETL